MKRKLMICGAAVFSAIFLFSGIMICRQYLDARKSAEAFESAAGLISAESALIGENAGKTETPLTSYEKYSGVYAKNNDFIGWITIPGTAIDYPVMQSKDNPNFYLKHSFDKSYSDYGVPYMQEDCDIGLSDNIVIYGHHMNNGSMFSDLCKYKSKDFYEEHKTIRFDILENFGSYEIVAAFKTVAYTEDSFKYFRFVNAENKADFDEYIAKCKELALYDTGVTAEYGDKLITLSTCEYSRTDGRMVIVAKKVMK